MPSAALPGGGPAPLITLKTHPPLPSFAIPHRLPDPSIEISSFKLSILRILTGQTNASSSTKPLTFSEQVKEKAINGWKMQMLTLELIQHDDLQSEQHNPPTQQQQIKGFQLQDHHECSLIEQGDMILVRLKQAHAIEELELPELGEAHSYSAPAGSLTRAGTLSQPPPYEIIQPSEPSSFSSSVGAQPNANYHQHRYQDYRSTFRVLTANNVGSGHMRRNTPSNTGYAGNAAGALSQGLKNLQSSSAAGKKDAPKAKRRASATATATAITKPSASPTVDQQHVISPPLSPSLHSAAATLLPATRRNSSSVVTVQANPRPTVGGALGSSSSPNPNAKSGGQFAGLPPTALVIGPGVQGQVGRNPSSVNAPMGASGPAELQYGNASGFVNFTSAGVWKSKPKPSRQASQEFSSDSNLLDSTPQLQRVEIRIADLVPPAQELSRTYGFGSSKQPQATAVPLEEMDSAIKPVLDAENHNLTRAERRYLEVQKALQVEREKQAEAEKLRAEEIRALRERKEKERERKESEAKKRAEEQKWEMWEEVRRRQKSGNLDKPLPPGIQRLYSGGEDKGNGGKGKGAAPVAAPAISVATAGLGELNLSSSQDSAPVAAGRNVDAGAASGSRLAAPAPRAALPSDSNGLTGQRIELGLERITLLLSRLKNPHRSFPVIHVAGTNGKGSTIAYLDSLLRNALDIRTGTFVSPHLIERRDCCKVDGRIIDKSIWRQAQSDVLFADQGLDIPATTEDNGQPLKSSPFELLTAQTFQAFSLLPEAERPEVLLIEVGLGGRLDATNVFEESQVLASVICPIDRDHEAFLGSKLEGIAREKAGIVKDGGLCIIADQRLHDPSPIDQLALGPLENETKQIGARAAGILDSIRNVCMSRNARLVKTYIPWKLLSLPPTKQAKWGSSVDFTPKLAPTLFLSTSGLNPPSTFVAHPHDPVMFSVPVSIERTRANLTGVCMTVQTLSSIARDEWAEDRWEDLRTRIMWGLRDDPEANLRVRESLNAVKWAGRCSWFTVGGREVLIDGAHNESSAIALREYIDNCLSSRSLSLGRGSQFEVTYIFAFSEGKDYESMVRAMLENPPDLVERQNVGLTVFSPPEGMPWVRSVEARDALATLKKVSREVDVGELRTFESIKEAIEWAGAGGRTGGSGKGREDKKERGPIVVAGSLYLVADMYRYLQSLGLYTE
ncbi:hypothetical protein NDA11_005940 [Ustilago hordei]|nr:hypothetical protein NDA11_005940 [Ustilago hordei]